MITMKWPVLVACAVKSLSLLCMYSCHVHSFNAFDQFPRRHCRLWDAKLATDNVPETSKNPTLLTPKNFEALKGLDGCTSGTQARRLLGNELSRSRSPNNGILYNSVLIPVGASVKGISDGDLAIQTRLANKKYKIMELIELSGDRDADRASLSIISVFVSSTIAAICANQNLPGPEIVRFLVVWLFCFAPLALVGYGIKDAEALQAILVQIQRNCFPAYRQRMIQHESGHFLLGHLLGWPVQGYTTNAVKNAVSFYPLSDQDQGIDRAKQLGFDKRPLARPDSDFDSLPIIPDVPYFSEEGMGASQLQQQSVFRNAKNYTNNPFLKLPSQNEPTNAWPYRGFSDDVLDQLTVISVAGVCSEILAMGNAEGGRADLSQLRQIFNSAQEEMTEREMDNRIRFALGFTMSVLRRHLGVLDELASAMEKDASVAECVAAIETCANASGQDGILGDYEKRRRDAFRANGLSVVERTFLGNGKNVDAVDDRFVEGPGGGFRKKGLAISGDEPFYLAIAVAGIFLLWASSGGVSLH